jgi:signal peptidase I
LWLFLAPPAWGGQLSVVTTHGISMKPDITSGDLAVVHRQHGYAVGDVVAYNSQILGRVVMHRIVGVDHGTFVFKGDNNDYLDPDRPSVADCIGRLVLHVPRGGLVLDMITSPVALTALAAALLAGIGASARPKRRRRRMSRHAADPRRSISLWTMSASRRYAWLAVLSTALVGVGVAIAAWTAPATIVTLRPDRATSSVEFSYSAQVKRSAAYETDVVSDPDPVFRKVANQVRVAYHYRGAPGDARVDAILRADSGWHATVPLSEPVHVSTPDFSGEVVLDLEALDAKAKKAAAVIGVPADQLKVTVVPTFTSLRRPAFSPELAFTMTQSRLALAGDASTLKVTDTTERPTSTRTARTFQLGPVAVSVPQVRFAGPALVALGLLGALFLSLAGRRRPAIDEAALIRRKHGHLLIEIEPSPTTPGRPLVDVTRFATLATLAERYGLLILHWSRSGVDTYLVQDQGATYRYRTTDVRDREGAPGTSEVYAAASSSSERREKALGCHRHPAAARRSLLG